MPSTKSTPETSPGRRSYATDLSDAEWQLIAPHVPEPTWFPNLQKPVHQPREIVNAFMYVARTGCQWRALPHDFPPWKSVFGYFTRWRKAGIVDAIHDALRDHLRTADGRSISPTLGIVDSQSVKTTEVAESRGFDAGKKVKGRKRHIMVDTLGLLMAVVVTTANVQDRDGAVPVVRSAHATFASLSKVLVDGAYVGAVIDEVAKDTGVDIEVVKRDDGKNGFVPVWKRWIVERTFAWIGRYRRTSKDYERYEETQRAFVQWAMIGTMFRRAARPAPR